MLGGEGEVFEVGGGPFKQGSKEENADAAEEAELKAELGGDEGIEKHFDEEGHAEEIEAGGVARDEFADEVKEGREPAPLDGWNGADEEEVEVDGDEENDQFGAMREEKAERKGTEGDQDGEVEAGNGENVLQP